MIKKPKLAAISILAVLLTILPLFAVQADDHQQQVIGVLESRPEEVNGVWVVAGKSYEVNDSTIFKDNASSLAVGACTKVEFEVSNEVNIALSIATAQDYECGLGNDTPKMQAYGYLVSFPADMVGEWVVDGVTYSADEDTEFDQDHGAFAEEICVDVKFLPDTNYLLEVETEYDYKCNGADSQYNQAYGVLESFPEGLIGEWVIDGQTYTADEKTQFEQEHGPFFVDGCVEIKYLSSDYSAIEIETKSIEHCGEEAEQKFYGMIETIPDGKLGTWVISGTEFTVTESTEFEEEDDISFAPGVCVEVEYYIMDSVNVAKEIESEDSYHCNGGSYNQEAYGLVEVYPGSLIGTWVISGINYVANQTTEFEQEHGSFGLGVCVKVKYSTQDGINHASEIETEETSDCNGTGEGLPVINKVYALLGNFPPDPFIGTWTIGGVDYEATDTTIFDQTNGDFDIGVCVEARYIPADGVNTLLKVESEHDYKCKDGDVYFPPHYVDYGISYGAIEMLPDTPDLIGTWRIGGVDYLVDATTYLSEEFGAFTVGTYVEVKFHFEQGNRMAYKISSHVAPGAGKNNLKGSLTFHESQDKLNDWVVDNITYQADSAIEVGAGTLKPAVGNTVFLNAYEVNGVQYVTSIQSPYMAFMPMAIR